MQCCSDITHSKKAGILIANRYIFVEFKWRTIRSYMSYSICFYHGNWWFQMFLFGLVSLECKQLRAPMLAPRRNQAITWTKLDFSAVKSCGIHCKCSNSIIRISLHWRHNEQDGVSITSLTTVYPVAYSAAEQRKHQSFASLAFVWGILWWPVNYPHKRIVAWNMFPFDDVIMVTQLHL